MATSNIVPRGNGGRLASSQWSQDPFQALHDDMDRLFGRLLSPTLRSTPTLLSDIAPLDFAQMDVRETNDAIDIQIDVPGMDVKDINVTLSEGVLTIKGERRTEAEEKREDYYCTERSYGAFQRRLALPAEVDDSRIDASVKKGVLSLHLPKTAKAKAQEKRIAIKAN